MLRRLTHFCQSQKVKEMFHEEAGDIGDSNDARFWILGDTGPGERE